MNTHPTDPDAALPSKVELRILPVAEPTLAAKRGTPEMNAALPVLEHLDVPTDDETLAPGTKPGFLQGPPLLVRIAHLEEAQLAAGSQREGSQHDGKTIHPDGRSGNAVPPILPGKTTPVISLRAGMTRLVRYSLLPLRRETLAGTTGAPLRSKLRAC